MSLNNYINCKKACIQLINELKDELDISTSTAKDLFFFAQKHTYLTSLKEECEKKIQELCNHEFETDLVDIDPDKSSTIQYCKICEYTNK